jgi:SSS family solute:Na+ symporter
MGFVLYVGLMIFIGWFFTRKSKEGTSFLTGGRSLSVFLVVCTAAATMIGTGGTMGKTGQGFATGLGAAGYAFGGSVAIFTIALLFTPMRKKNFITMAEEIQYYFAGSKWVRNIGAVLMFLVEVCYMSSHMTGGARYIQYVTGMGPETARLICLLAFTIYVFIGGYMAVVWTDVVQLGVILLGFGIILIRTIGLISGWNEIRDAFLAVGKPEALVLFGFGHGGSFIAALTLLITSALSEMGASTFRHRVYTSKNAKSARKSFLITGCITVSFTFFPVFLGMATFVLAQKNSAVEILNNPDFAFGYLATELMGPILGLILLIAGLSATMSSGDSDAIAGVTILIKDIWPTFTGKQIGEGNIKKASRNALLIVLFVAFLLTLTAGDFISFITNVFGSLMPALVITTIIGRVWKRVTPPAGVASMVLGTLFGICYLAVKPLNAWIRGTFTGPVIPVAVLTIIILVVVSLCTKRPNLSDQQILEVVLADRTDLTPDQKKGLAE